MIVEYELVELSSKLSSDFDVSINWHLSIFVGFQKQMRARQYCSMLKIALLMKNKITF